MVYQGAITGTATTRGIAHNRPHERIRASGQQLTSGMTEQTGQSNLPRLGAPPNLRRRVRKETNRPTSEILPRVATSPGSKRALVKAIIHAEDLAPSAHRPGDVFT